MTINIPSNKTSFNILIGVRTFQPELLRVMVRNPYNPDPSKYKDRFYIYRRLRVNGYYEFDIKMPVSPVVSELSIFNLRNRNYPDNQDKSFQIEKFKVLPLKQNPIWMSLEDRQFNEFAKEFCERANWLDAGTEEDPSVYYCRTNPKFYIAYSDILRDKKTGYISPTPARVGHQTGKMSAAKSIIENFTVPETFLFFRHEYAHIYQNPEQKNPVAYELGADVNAMYYYLSEGFSEMEAVYGMARIFGIANTPENHKRFLTLLDFIERFKRGEFNNISTDYAKNAKK